MRTLSPLIDSLLIDHSERWLITDHWSPSREGSTLQASKAFWEVYYIGAGKQGSQPGNQPPCQWEQLIKAEPSSPASGARVYDQVEPVQQQAFVLGQQPLLPGEWGVDLPAEFTGLAIQSMEHKKTSSDMEVGTQYQFSQELVNHKRLSRTIGKIKLAQLAG